MCKKRVELLSGTKTVTCEYCRRKMLASKCQKQVVAHVTLEKHEYQYELTIFPNVLEDFGLNPTSETLEEELLELVDVDVYFNRRRIVTKIQNHPEDDI